MPEYVFTYRRPEGQALNMEEGQAWFKWFDEIGEHISVPGNAVAVARRVGNVAGDQDVSGFSVITARDIDHAVEIAQGCPAVAQGYGLEVGELMAM
jgi:hypothetical protein